MLFTISTLPKDCKDVVVKFRRDCKRIEAARSNYTDVLRMYHRLKATAHTSILFSISGELDATGTAEQWMDVLDDLGLLTSRLSAELEDHTSVEDCDE